MRYQVRDREGRELTVPSLADLAALHRSGFLGDDDLVRPERATRWTRAGDMPALAARAERRLDRRWALAVLAAAVLLVAALALLQAGAGRGAGPAGDAGGRPGGGRPAAQRP